MLPVIARSRVMLPTLAGIVLWTSFAIGADTAQLPPVAAGKIDFQRDIQPIFAQRCYECHGEKKSKSGLRLDDKTRALQGGDSGKPPFVAGKSAESQLILRVAGLVKDDEIMPPEGDRLTARQIGLLRAWIDQGAVWPDDAHKPIHWAYVKPVSPAPPRTKTSRWVRNPIDAFVLAKLQKEKLKPSPEADRATLIRRLSLDLIGLPPTLAEVDAFVADKRKDAYDRLVDRLLASPHYGEKWTREWLDLARYADTHGYEKDPRRSMWPYRDWVIQALNADMPFDEFTVEQIAGDLLPKATREQKVASGFHRNTMFNTEGGVDAEQSRVETIVDRVNTTAGVWLGSTMGCAQCHTHKYDPFTIKEYYQMFAFFNDCDEPELDLPSPEQAKHRDRLKADIAQQEKDYKKQTPELAAAQAAWEKKHLEEEARWTALDATNYSSAGSATFTKLADKSLLAGGKNSTNDVYTVTAPAALEKITGMRLEVFPDNSLPQKSLGRDPNGSFVLSRFEVTAAPAERPEAAQKLVFTNASAEYTQEGHSVTNLIDGKPGPGWAISASENKYKTERAAYFELEKPLAIPGGAILTVTLRNDSIWSVANVGRFRIAVTEKEKPVELPGVSSHIRAMLAESPDRRTEKQTNELNDVFREQAPELKPVREQLAKLREEEKKLKEAIPTTLVMKERKEPRETHVLARGNFLSPGEKVAPGVPAILPPLPAGETNNRLTLARWLVSADNPLTARVTVNRIWGQYFGHGLVETVEDFGTQGERPTHPELLDWLATEFVRQGWSMRALHRLIVTSATYRQSSRTTPALLERDPYNRWFARGPRFRVPAETVRDICLAASGLLTEKIGGPSVFPYQPDGIWTQIYSGDKWETSKGEDKYRRGLYTFWRRTSPYPAFMSFDSPSRELICTRRARSNTPLQALTTLNDPAFVEAAEALARRMMNEASGGAEQRAAYGFRLCTSRPPGKQELKRIVALYNEELQRYNEDGKAAEKLIKGDSDKPPVDVKPAEAAAWTVVANVLLNLDETITKD
jgi:hypothetical protein